MLRPPDRISHRISAQGSPDRRDTTDYTLQIETRILQFGIRTLSGNIRTRLLQHCKAILADRSPSAYTVSMTLKNAAFLALVGMILATILLVAGFIRDVFAIAQGLIPAMTLLTSFIYAFAGLSMAVFLYAFHKKQ